METKESQQPKWEGETCAEVTGLTADQVWALLEDFFSLNKWFRGIYAYEHVEGVSGQPGCIRKCTQITAASSETAVWANERLVAFDPAERCFSYDILENNVGFKSYLATMKVVPAEEDGGRAKDGCKIRWSFVSDPIEGWSGGFQGFLSYLEYLLPVMVKNLQEEALSSK